MESSYSAAPNASPSSRTHKTSCCSACEKHHHGSLYQKPQSYPLHTQKKGNTNTMTDASSVLYRGQSRGNDCTLTMRKWIQKHFYSLECFIHRHRWKVIVLGVLILGLCCLGLKTVKFENNVEKLWMEDNGRLRTELKYISNTLGGDGHLGSMEAVLQTGGNMLTPTALLDHLDVLMKMRLIKVRVGAKIWYFKDICQKASLPYRRGDMPSHRLEEFMDQLIPCAVITPLDCFWEGSKVMGPDKRIVIPWFGQNIYVQWSNLDPVDLLEKLRRGYMDPDLKKALEDTISTFQATGINHGYQNRTCLDPFDPECPVTAPNYRKKAPRVADTVSGGCPGYAAKLLRYPEALLLGGTHRQTGSGVLTSARAVQSLILLRSPKDLYNEVQQRSPYYDYENWSVEQAYRVIQEWQREFKKTVEMHNAVSAAGPPGSAPSQEAINNASTFYTFTENSLSDILTDVTTTLSPIKLGGGLILVVLYTVMCFLRWQEAILSHCWLALASFTLVTLSLVAGLGISAVVGLKFNALTIQVLPFLMLGIGMDNVFAMTYQHAKLASQNPSQSIIGITLQLCGPSVLFASTSSSAAFFAAASIPVPLMRTFSLQAGILSLFHCIAVLFVHPALLSLDLSRRRNYQLDVFCCISNPLSNNSTIESSQHGSPQLPPSQRRSPGDDPFTLSAFVMPRSASAESRDLLLDPVMTSSTSSASSFAPSTCGEPRTWPDEPPMDNQPHSLSSSVQSKNVARTEQRSWKQLAGQVSVSWFISRLLAPGLQKLPVKVLVIGSAAVIFGVSVYGTFQLRYGLRFDSVMPENSLEKGFAKFSSRYFGLYNFHVITKGEFDYPNSQRLLRRFYGNFRNVKSILGARGRTDNVRNRGSGPNSGIMVFWIEAFRDWLTGLQKAFDADVANDFITPDGRWTANASENGVLGLRLIVQSADGSIDMQRISNGRLVSNGEIDPQRFYVYLRAWRSMDTLGYASLSCVLYPEPQEYSIQGSRRGSSGGGVNELTPIPHAQPIEFTQTSLYMTGVSSSAVMLDVVKSIRTITDHYETLGLPNFPNGVPFTLCEQYLHLGTRLALALGLSAVGLLLPALFTFLAVLPSLLALAGAAFTVTEVAGLGFGLLGYELNASGAVILVIAVGQAVRYQAPILVGVVSAIGTREMRSREALRENGPPAVHAAVSTLLGVALLVASPLDFVNVYFFQVMSLAVVISLLNALFLLPTICSLIGPPSEAKNGESSMQPPTPTPAPPSATPSPTDGEAPDHATVQGQQRAYSCHTLRSRPVSLSTISEEPSHLSSTASLNSATSGRLGNSSILVMEPEITLHTTPHHQWPAYAEIGRGQPYYYRLPDHHRHTSCTTNTSNIESSATPPHHPTATVRATTHINVELHDNPPPSMHYHQPPTTPKEQTKTSSSSSRHQPKKLRRYQPVDVPLMQPMGHPRYPPPPSYRQ